MTALLCFDTRGRGWWWGPQLCVPSSTDGTPPVGTPAPPTGTESTSSTSTSTTPTTPAPPSQPCPGVVIDGTCVIDL